MPNPVVANASFMKDLPSVDQLLRTKAAVALSNSTGRKHIVRLARAVTDKLRLALQNGAFADNPAMPNTRESLLDEAVRRLEGAWRIERLSGLTRVINATGVIIHTNLGRAPLSDAARDALAREAAGYCALEFNIATGSRGRRGQRVEELLTELTGAEDALVVNNCAAAALLILAVLAADGETIVSRGELVEIGGDFRVPDVMASSGTRMIEVGTTNRTKLEDYREALTDRTRLIMRVHPSNYRIVGFTASPSVAELSDFAHEAELPLYEDAGSGVLCDLSQYGLADEPIISQSISSGADVVSFSGDKLLGACQAGLIVGQSKIVSRLRKHPLYRALRADKLSLAVLEKTLESHRRGQALEDVPALRALALTKAQVEGRAESLLARYREQSTLGGLTLELQDGESAIGGGAGPNTHPPTVLIAVQHANHKADEIEQALRLFNPPIIARIAEDKVLIDLRTVAPQEESEILAALSTIGK